MRNLVIIIVCGFIIVGCKKSTGNSAPKIKFKAITELIDGNIPITAIPPPPKPILTIQVLDDDGDLGFNDGKDTSYIYIKNLSIAPDFRADSFKFPTELSTLSKSTFKNYVDVEIDLNALGIGRNLVYPSNKPRPRRDTMYFEVYVKDFAKNKSNVIKTSTPLILTAL